MNTFVNTIQDISFQSVDSNFDKRQRQSVDSDEEVENQYAKKRVGRKAIDDDSSDKSSDDPATKRKAQNRAAQKAFRERKLNHIRVLEQKIELLQQKEDEKNLQLLSENEKLKQTVDQLEKEKALLLGASISIDYIQQQQQQQSNTKTITPDIPVSTLTNTSPTFNVNNSMEPNGLQIDKLMDEHNRMIKEEEEEMELEAISLSNGTQASPCPTPEEIARAWDRVSEHPRFDEFDHQLICSETRRRMREEGVDHNTAVDRVIEEHYPVYPFLK